MTSSADEKLLWGRAAGICSNPQCQVDLTVILERGHYNFAEMAHIIAKSEKGPRGEEGGGSDTYENLILLCPTCHTKIDKAPEGTFTQAKLHTWKKEHEETRASLSCGIKVSTFEELKQEVVVLLSENYEFWKTYGPKSGIASQDPESNAYKVWKLKKLSRLIPNNKKIINLIINNKKWLTTSQLESFSKFKIHAESFEQHQYTPLDYYPTFPKEFSEIFSLSSVTDTKDVKDSSQFDIPSCRIEFLRRVLNGHENVTILEKVDDIVIQS